MVWRALGQAKELDLPDEFGCVYFEVAREALVEPPLFEDRVDCQRSNGCFVALAWWRANTK